MKNWQFAVIAIIVLLIIGMINNHLSKPTIEELKYKAQQDSIKIRQEAQKLMKASGNQ